MAGNGSQMPQSAENARAADQPTSAAERSASDADQSAADADQTASDADQAASSTDDADAASDQQASDQDQATSDDELPADATAAERETHEQSREAREETTDSRKQTRGGRRAKTTRSRARTAAERDATAARRDETAQRRDARAQAIERWVAGSQTPLSEKIEQIRARAEADRARAAADRERAAQDRADAARELARLEAELQTAHLDALTGAFRREMGWLALSHEIDHARRGDGQFVLAFVDVDDMKGVNDRDGHAAGDRVLQMLVAAMRSNLRSFDPIVRYGGDEFVCGLGGPAIAEVERRFALIDRSLRTELGVGISVGLAEIAADETLDELAARADAELLDVKKRRPEAARDGSGRIPVKVAGEQPVHEADLIPEIQAERE